MSKTIKKILLSISLFLIPFSFAAAANYDNITGYYDATYGYGAKAIQGNSGLSSRTVPEIIGNAIKVILGLCGTVALVIVVYAGVEWMTSSGNEEKIKHAQKLMINGAIGIIIIAAAYAITDFIIKQLTAVV